MGGRTIKLHNRRVSIYEWEEDEESVLIQFVHFDKDVYRNNTIYMGEFGAVLESGRCHRKVSVKISKEALSALAQIGNEMGLLEDK